MIILATSQVHHANHTACLLLKKIVNTDVECHVPMHLMSEGENIVYIVLNKSRVNLLSQAVLQ